MGSGGKQFCYYLRYVWVIFITPMKWFNANVHIPPFPILPLPFYESDNNCSSKPAFQRSGLYGFAYPSVTKQNHRYLLAAHLVFGLSDLLQLVNRFVGLRPRYKVCQSKTPYPRRILRPYKITTGILSHLHPMYLHIQILGRLMVVIPRASPWILWRWALLLLMAISLVTMTWSDSCVFVYR